MAREDYTIKAGDTLTSIAAAHNVTPDNLVKWNSLMVTGENITVPDVEEPGPPVVVDPDQPTVTAYEAQSTDTWSSIATKFDVPVDKLLELNGIKVVAGATYIVKKTPPAPPVIPYANGLPKVDEESPSAKVLQTELIRVGYMPPTTVLANNYGPMTQAAVVAFHNDNPQFRSSVYDPQIGEMGWAFLRGMATGSGKVTVPVQNTSGRLAVNSVTYNKTSIKTGKTFATQVIKETLTLMGLPVTDAWVNGYLTMALRESSYNPNAVNTTDSNAKNVPEINGGENAPDGHKGQCSRGMWQCIPQTFAAYHQAGTDTSIYDPWASCAASINYVRSRYGVKNDGSNLAQKVQQADPNRDPNGY